MNFTKNKMIAWAIGLCMATSAISCLPDEFGDGNGLGAAPVADFTVTPIEGKINTYLLQADTEGVLGVKWNLDDGEFSGNAIDTAFFPDAGDYNITLTAIGRGGMKTSATSPLTVASSDPNAGNLVLGGKMEEGNDAYWNFVTYAPGVSLAIADGKMVATGGGWGHAGMYQALEVEGGKKYKVDMLVSGSGATDTWFEVYVGKAAPVEGSDYSDGGKRLALSTWGGCGNAAFNGKLSVLSCDGKDKGVFSFPESGTAYLFIRTGGADLGTSGIAIDNVELRGVK